MNLLLKTYFDLLPKTKLLRNLQKLGKSYLRDPTDARKNTNSIII
jgi:hypothetical protein